MTGKRDFSRAREEIRSGKLSGFYWVFGPEQAMARRIVDGLIDASGVRSDSIERFDGADADADSIARAAETFGLFGGRRLVIVRRAHLVRELDAWEPLLDADPSERILVLLAKDLDMRRKFSKLVLSKAVAVECGPVREEERGRWIRELARDTGLPADSEGELSPEVLEALERMEPWSLELVEREIEKLVLAPPELRPELLRGASGLLGSGARMADALLNRDRRSALFLASALARSPDEALPGLGLIAWNFRHLASSVRDRETGERSFRLYPSAAERISQAAREWTQTEVSAKTRTLARADHALKQRPLSQLGIWATLAK